MPFKDSNALFDDTIYFGADIGTTNSYVAYNENGRARIPARFANGLPTLFWRDKDGNEWYCDQVVNGGGLWDDPANVWVSGKMKLKDGPVKLGNKEYEAKVLFAKIVNYILTVGKTAMEEEEMITVKPQLWVVGIPVLFDTREKEALEAAIQAITGVRVRLVNEAVLAAINYYDCLSRQNSNILKEDHKVIVLDIGGGTSDVVVLVTNPNPDFNNPEPFIPLNPAGIRKAGDDIDKIAEQILLEKIRENPGTINVKRMEDPNDFDRRRLRQFAKEAKENLSSMPFTNVVITCKDHTSTMVRITRDELEERIRPLLKEIVELAASVLEKCNYGVNPDIDILLVGGTSNIPLLKKMIAERFYWLSEDKIIQRNPSTAIALGASIFAKDPNLASSNVAYGYGVNTHTEDGVKEVLRVMIPSVARLPMTVSANFSTLNENQNCAQFKIYEVYDVKEGDIHLDLVRGRLTSYSITHNFKTNVPRNTPIKLTVTLTENGVLTAMVEDFLPDKHVYRETFTLNGTASN